MRWPGTGESRSQPFGPVLYHLNPKRNPAYFDTLYASGETLRTGIYQMEGDRLILCWTATDFGKGRPSKFGGFYHGGKGSAALSGYPKIAGSREGGVAPRQK
jgi:hypothetical protein